MTRRAVVAYGTAAAEPARSRKVIGVVVLAVGFVANRAREPV
ncbi:hypothetical protein GCM10027589_07760 [Actinocorallia lasiicapitis]